MSTNATLAATVSQWQEAADRLLARAEHIGPLDPGPFGELSAEDGREAQAAGIDAAVEELLTRGEDAWLTLGAATDGPLDGSFQAASLLSATLAIADSLLLADTPGEGAFAGLSVDEERTAAFDQTRAIVAAAGVVIAAPESLGTNLDALATAGATESFAVLTGSVGKLAGGALVSGLDGVLRGAAAVAYAALREHLSGWWAALKRGVVWLTEWVVDKVKSLLPESLAGKLDDLIASIQTKIEEGAVGVATDLYGRLLGRGSVEAAWHDAAKAGRDLTGAEKQIPEMVTAHTARIGWITTGRTVVERYDALVSAAVGVAPAAAQLGFAALVAAVLAFVALQVWSGFNALEALV